jgi:hypothetical protein
MKMIRSTFALAMIAGAAASTAALAQPTKESVRPSATEARPSRHMASPTADRVGQARLLGHVRINHRTGERQITRFDRPGSVVTPREGPLMYDNSDVAGSYNFFYGIDNPDLAVPAIGYEGLDWGDFSSAGGITPCVDGFSFAYAGDGRMGLDPLAQGVVGLNAVIRFYRNDNGFNDLQAEPLAEIRIEELPGHDGSPPPPGQTLSFVGWLITIDLEGTPGAFTVTGSDLDFDGLRDISWSYQFDQQQIGGPAIMGPFLVRPASLGGLGNATGVEDAFDEFTTAPRTGYTGTWLFGTGGGQPIPGSPGAFYPYASFYMKLFGDVSGPCPAVTTCYANCDESTTEPILNVDDFTCFINAYAASSTLPHEQQVASYANCDGSTVAPALNVDDFTCFINAFAAGCLP